MIARVGSEIDAWCTKCKLDLTHRLVAVFEAKPKRVECETCHSQHNYRKPKGAAGKEPRKTATRTPKATTSTGKRRTKSETELLAQWEERVQGKPSSAFVRYSVKESFTPDQLVEHKQFGPGVVAQVLQDNKIAVLFRDGQKVLAHARA